MPLAWEAEELYLRLAGQAHSLISLAISTVLGLDDHEKQPVWSPRPAERCRKSRKEIYESVTDVHSYA